MAIDDELADGELATAHGPRRRPGLAASAGAAEELAAAMGEDELRWAVDALRRLSEVLAQLRPD